MDGNKLYPTIEFEPHEETRVSQRTLRSDIDSEAPPSRMVGSIRPERSIPDTILRHAKGLAILTVVKVGLMATYNIGTGLVITCKEDGSWSAPSAISSFGVGWGAQVGGELTDYIIVLRTKEAVTTFSGNVHFSIGAGLSAAVGIVGRVAEADLRTVVVVMQLVTQTAALKAHLLVAHLKEAWLPHAHQRTPDSMVVHLSMHQISCLVHCPGHLRQPLSTMLCQSYSRSLKNDPSIRYWVRVSFLTL